MNTTVSVSCHPAPWLFLLSNVGIPYSDKVIDVNSMHSLIELLCTVTKRARLQAHLPDGIKGGGGNNVCRRNYVMKLGISGFHNRAESHSFIQSDCTPLRHVVFIYVT